MSGQGKLVVHPSQEIQGKVFPSIDTFPGHFHLLDTAYNFSPEVCAPPNSSPPHRRTQLPVLNVDKFDNSSLPAVTRLTKNKDGASRPRKMPHVKINGTNAFVDQSTFDHLFVKDNAQHRHPQHNLASFSAPPKTPAMPSLQNMALKRPHDSVSGLESIPEPGIKRIKTGSQGQNMARIGYPPSQLDSFINASQYAMKRPGNVRTATTAILMVRIIIQAKLCI